MEEKDTFLEEIVIAGDSHAPVQADLFSRSPGEELPLIIVCHGFLGYKRWGFLPYLSGRLALAGFHVLAMSFSLNGIDEETGLFTRPEDFALNTVSREIEDLRRTCLHVRNGLLPLPVAGMDWGLMGYSRGAAITILAAGEISEVRSLVTWATPSRLDRYTRRRKERWKTDGEMIFTDVRSAVPLRLYYSYYQDIAANRKRFELPGRAASLEIPHLLVHGERDAAVTLRETERLLNPRAREGVRLEVIKGCSHTFGIVHPMSKTKPCLERAVGLTERWFRQTLDGK